MNDADQVLYFITRSDLSKLIKIILHINVSIVFYAYVAQNIGQFI